MPITIMTAPSATPDWSALGADVATLLVAGPAVEAAALGDVVHAAVRREAPRLADHIRDLAPDDVLVVVHAERTWSAARALVTPRPAPGVRARYPEPGRDAPAAFLEVHVRPGSAADRPARAGLVARLLGDLVERPGWRVLVEPTPLA